MEHNNSRLKHLIDLTINENKNVKWLTNTTIENAESIKKLTLITTENRESIKKLTLITTENRECIKKLTDITSKNSKSIESIKSEQLRYGILQESMDSKLDTLIELVTDPIKRTERIPALHDQLEDHELRIRSIERSLISEKN